MTIRPVLVIHGGAGVMPKALTPERERSVLADLSAALAEGYGALAQGGRAVDAVARAVVVLEDSPYFNAGRGAVFTYDGHNELDAAIMDGATLRAGAVAAVRRVRNPVLLARAVMEASPHVMLAGEGADAFAEAAGIERVEPGYFRTDERWRQLQEARAAGAGDSTSTGIERFGTVGAVALDVYGNLAAATSTGGMTAKRWGRIGDSPVIGAGTYANSACAVSGTGWGEFYIRTVAAHAICMRVSLLDESPAAAAEAVILGEIPRLGGDGGAIVLGADGTIATPFNTEGMYRGWIDANGREHVAIR